MDAIKANTQSKMTSFKDPAIKQNSQSAVQKKRKNKGYNNIKRTKKHGDLALSTCKLTLLNKACA